MRILVVEDDELLSDFIEKCLEKSGFDVDVQEDGLKGYKTALKKKYDGIILDIKLPNKQGTEICADLRDKGVKTPILFLSSKDSTEDRITGLDLGADDYLTKPFSYEELVARVRALCRRPADFVKSSITYGELTLDTAKHKVLLRGKKIKLTPKEFQLLEVLMRNSETVLSREYLLNRIWGVTVGNTSNRLEVCIRSLRGKLGTEDENGLINTEYGVGYKLSK